MDDYDQEILEQMQEEQRLEDQMLKIAVEKAQHAQTLGEALSRLFENPDFNLLIRKNYLLNYLNFKLDIHSSNRATQEVKTMALEAIKGVGQFRKYLEEIEMSALEAEETLKTYTQDNIETATTL